MKSTGLCEVVLPCIQEDSSKITDSPEYLTPLGHTFFEAFLWVIKTLLSCEPKCGKKSTGHSCYQAQSVTPLNQSLT